MKEAVTKSLQPKCLALQNYRLILRMIDEQGWILRNTIIWNKPNHMPSSVKDRFSNAYEPVFMLVKNKKYYFDLDAVREPFESNKYDRARMARARTEYGGKWAQESGGAIKMQRAFVAGDAKGKNPGDVWTIPTQPFPEAHFATFPEKLIEPMVKAGCPEWICKKCGKARVRITKPTKEYAKNLGGKGFAKKDWIIKGGGSTKANNYPSATAQYQTIGWTDCGCSLENKWRSGIVLDPFGGSGTVGIVAKKLGRSYILIDLQPDYCKMAEKRIANTMGRFL